MNPGSWYSQKAGTGCIIVQCISKFAARNLVMRPGESNSDASPEERIEERKDAAETFFTSVGGVEVLSTLGLFEELSFNEMKEKMSCSPTTLSNRLDDAEKAGLIENTIVDSEHGTKKVYYYTSIGQNILTEFRRRDIDELFHQLQTLEEQLDKRSASLAEWMIEERIMVPIDERDMDTQPVDKYDWWRPSDEEP